MNRIDFVYRMHFKNKQTKKKAQIFLVCCGSSDAVRFGCLVFYFLMEIGRNLNSSNSHFPVRRSEWVSGGVRAGGITVLPVSIGGQERGGGRSLGPLGSTGGWEQLQRQTPRVWHSHHSFSLQPLCGLWPHLYLSGMLEINIPLKEIVIGASMCRCCAVIRFTELVKSPSFLSTRSCW